MLQSRGPDRDGSSGYHAFTYMALQLHPALFVEVRGMRRTFWLIGGLVGLSSAIAIGCGSSDSASGDRFAPGDEIVSGHKKDAAPDDTCEAGVCSPPPSSGGPDNGGPAPERDGGAPPATSGACKTLNACASATDLGSVSGDTGADTRSHQGSGGEFFTIRVTEDDHSAFGRPLTLAITLVSPARENYDLYVYDTDCSKPSEQSTQGAGTTDTVNLKWGELGYLANDIDDSKTIRVEVRPNMSTCDDQKWTLVLAGNAN